MLAKELYQELESKITQENKKIIKEYLELVKSKGNTSKVFFSVKELNKIFNNKFQEGAYNNFYIKNRGFNIEFFPYIKHKETLHFLIEESSGKTKYRTIVTEKFTKTSSVSEKANEILNLNIGNFIINLVHAKDKKHTNKEIQDLVNIAYPKNKASKEIIAMFIKHQEKLKKG